MLRWCFVALLIVAGVIGFGLSVGGDPCGRGTNDIAAWGFIVGAVLLGCAASLVGSRLSRRTWVPLTAGIVTAVVFGLFGWAVLINRLLESCS